MLPNKEIYDLAKVLMKSEEYINMAEHSKSFQNNQ